MAAAKTTACGAVRRWFDADTNLLIIKHEVNNMGKLDYIYEENAADTAIASQAAGTTVLIATKIDGSRLRGFKVVKVNYNMGFAGLDDPDGPIVWGLCTGVSAAEVTEAIAADPQSPDDVPASERTHRHVFPMGWMSQFAPFQVENHTMSPLTPQWEFLLNWSIKEGQTLNWFFFVPTGGNTIGASAHVARFAKFTGVWLND